MVEPYEVWRHHMVPPGFVNEGIAPPQGSSIVRARSSAVSLSVRRRRRTWSWSGRLLLFATPSGDIIWFPPGFVTITQKQKKHFWVKVKFDDDDTFYWIDRFGPDSFEIW
eukprot:SAG22_NODE_366_length_11615_cov_13.379125_11_plen_110_part_00